MSAAAVAFLRDALLQTIGIACGSLVIALVVGAPLSFVLARGGTAGRVVAIVGTVVRAIPDLVLAIVCVVAFGLGPIAAVIALGTHYAAVVAKMFADVLGSVRREPAEALRATGATAAAAFAVGLVPIAWPGLVGFAVYCFESIVRASVIVGVVGAGGIGSLLVQQLNLADYHGFALSVVALGVLVLLVEAFGSYLRLRASPRIVAATLVAVAVIGVGAFALTGDPPWRMLGGVPAHVADYAAHAVPQLTPAIARTAAIGAAQSVAVALVGTLIGALLALPAAALVATPFARGWVRGSGWRPYSWLPELLSRALLAAGRAVPPLALALVGVILLGAGPMAGIFALALHTAGVLGKLLAESFDVADRAPAEALIAGGATGAAGTLIALVPAARAAMTAHVLYRFEWNVRAATILGMIGAGGLGQAIFNAQQLLFYRQLSTYVIVAVALVLAIDGLGARLRARLRLQRLAM